MLSASAISPMHVCSRRRGLLGKQKADDFMQRKFDVILVLLEFFFSFSMQTNAQQHTAHAQPSRSRAPSLPCPSQLCPDSQKNKKKTRGKQNRLPPRGKTGVSSRRHSSQTPPSLPFLSPLPVPQELGKQTHRPAPVPSIIH